MAMVKKLFRKFNSICRESQDYSLAFKLYKNHVSVGTYFRLTV